MQPNRWTVSSALLFAGMGAVATIGGITVPSSRAVLVALAGIFFFAGAAVYFLVPTGSLRTTIDQRIHATLLANEEDLIRECDLQDLSVYVPRVTDESVETEPQAWLFVPRYADYEVPHVEALNSLFVDTISEQEQGISLRPTGDALYIEFESLLEGSVSESIDTLVSQLVDGIVGGLELADDIVVDIEADDNRVVFDISGSEYDLHDQFDHPLQSFLGMGLATGLGHPVVAETTATDSARFEYRVSCRWEQIERSGKRESEPLVRGGSHHSAGRRE